jgi:hypothetical protein
MGAKMFDLVTLMFDLYIETLTLAISFEYELILGL